MDQFSEVSDNVRWKRWNRGIFRALVVARAVGLRTRRSSGRGDLYAELQSELFVYGALSSKRIPGYDRRRLKRFLAGERRGIRALVRQIQACGDRVFWVRRRDGFAVDILIAGPTCSRAAHEARPRTSRCDHSTASA
jgi:hypothetical protein